MKKILLSIMALLVAIAISAQKIELTPDGAYECQTVVEVPGVSAADIYGRAMEALSDWNGPDGKSQAGLDFHDKEIGTIIYKGRYYLGFKNLFLGAGWHRYGEFTLKVRCKDEKAQIIAATNHISSKASRSSDTSNFSVAEVVAAMEKANGKKRKRGEEFVQSIVDMTDLIMNTMSERLRQLAAEDF